MGIRWRSRQDCYSLYWGEHPVANRTDDERWTALPSDGSRRGMRKDKIRAAATRLFAERGYEGTSMGDLAAEVGIRKASLFHHFESKQALYSDVLHTILADIASAIVNSERVDMTIPARLDFISDAIVELFFSNPYSARVLFREAMNPQPEVEGTLFTALAPVNLAGMHFIEEGQAAGVFSRSFDAAHMMISFVGIFGVPFSMPEVVNSLYGMSSFGPEFLEARKREVRMQLRLLLLSR